MKVSKVFIGCLVVVFVLAAAGYGLYVRNVNMANEQNAAETERMKTVESSTPQVAEEDTTSPSESSDSEPAATTQPGKYVDYSDDVISKNTGTKLLFFHAPWCSQCRMIEGDIKEYGVPNDVTVIKVDYDSNQSLRQKYGVTLQTTFVKINDDGTLVQKYVAYNEPTFDSVKRNLL